MNEISKYSSKTNPYTARRVNYCVKKVGNNISTFYFYIIMSLYEELWNNPDFIRKRVQEQVDYIHNLKYRNLSEERYCELFWGAVLIYKRFIDQLYKLEGGSET